MGKAGQRVAIFPIATDSMVQSCPSKLRNSDDSRAHIFHLIRDKDTDITWLFGPWKRCAGLQPFLSYSQLQPGEPASVSFPRTDQGLIQKKFDSNAPRSILLPPRPLSICNPPKKKVCLD